MTLVLATGAPTASGHAYDDVVGVRYEFPRAYRRLMTPGSSFVYYRGRRAASVGLPGPAYFGTGVVGLITELGGTDLSAEILDYAEFGTPVSIRDAQGSYYEAAAATNRRYWLRGVRPIDDYTLAAIVAASDGAGGREPDTAAKGPAYAASKAELDAVERYSVDVALALLAEGFGREAVTEMPRNNPGFDILVRLSDAELHVEVKGTRRPWPVFFMSEGERLHSVRHAPTYRLCVISNIDLVAASHVVHWHRGAVANPPFEMAPRQWQVRLADEG